LLGGSVRSFWHRHQGAVSESVNKNATRRGLTTVQGRVSKDVERPIKTESRNQSATLSAPSIGGDRWTCQRFSGGVKRSTQNLITQPETVHLYVPFLSYPPPSPFCHTCFLNFTAYTHFFFTLFYQSLIQNLSIFI
jgi:hypothetical protein